MLELQRKYFATGKTLPISSRIKKLRKLYKAVGDFEDEIYAALFADLGKSPKEAYLTEVYMVQTEIRHAIKNLHSWAAPQKIPVPITQFYSKGQVLTEPLGVCLIISPWNYPFLLSLSPLISAIAAGNCVTLKPSELSPNTSTLLSMLISTVFEERFCSVVEGDGVIADMLTAMNFDMIFFTGSPRVGKLVMKNAASNLTPVVLELGGKSPCIVESDSDIKIAARRILWGKLINSGQTCVAPDYVLVHSSVKQLLVAELQKNTKRFYGSAPLKNSTYPSIINRRHFDRLRALLKDANILFGGECDADKLKIAPTVIEVVDMSSQIMTEEIFGPILPIISYSNLDDAITFIKARPKPLALYLFTRCQQTKSRVTQELSFGGGCINDTISHILANEMPFGGVGQSGMGKSHGKSGFNSFSHKKSILNKNFHPDIGTRYPPYSWQVSFLKRLMK